jgi:hypothetical protein
MRHAAAQSPDYFVFHFSGHGSRRGICLVDGLLSYAELAAEFRRMGAARSLVIIDACEAAAFYDFHRHAVMGGPLEQAAAEIMLLAATPGMRMMFAVAKGRLARERDELRHGIFTHAILRALHQSRGDLELWGTSCVSDLQAFNAATGFAAEYEQVPVSVNLRGDLPLVVSEADMEIGTAAIALRSVTGGLGAGIVISGRRFVPTVVRVSLVDARGRAVLSRALAFTPAREQVVFNPSVAFPVARVQDDLWCEAYLRRNGRLGFMWMVSVEDQHGHVLDSETHLTWYAPGWGAGAPLWIE